MSSVGNMKVVHRREQTESLHPELAKRPLCPLERVGRFGIQQEVRDDAIGKGARGSGDGCFVTGNARDENDARNPMAVELAHPARGERLRILIGKLERQALPEHVEELASVGRRWEPGSECREEAVREEVRVGVGNGELAETRVHVASVSSSPSEPTGPRKLQSCAI